MARETRSRSGRITKYGMCVNEECEMYKQVQGITHGDFVCEKCQKPLTSCPPPAEKSNKGKLIAIICGILVLLAIIVGFVVFGGSSSEEQQPQVTVTDSIAKTDSVAIATQVAKDTVIVTDTVVQRDTVKVEVPAKPKEIKSSPVTTSGSKNLGYATFRGSWPNDVNGRMVFKTSHVIDSKDPKGRVAEAGDYVIGEWSDGHLVQGIWYGADNQVKGSVIIGK